MFANAGIASSTPVGTTTLAAFEEVLNTNLTGVFCTVQAAAPSLNQGASVVWNGSVHSVLGAPGYAAYTVSKRELSIKSFLSCFDGLHEVRKARQ